MVPGISGAPMMAGGDVPLGIVGSNSGQSGGTANTHTINLPADIEDGDLLTLIFATRDTRAFTAPAGWTELISTFSGVSVALSVAYKIADGSEGATTTCSTSSTASRSAHVTLRVKGFQGVPVAPGAFAGSQNTAPNPPSISPAWGTGSETLFLAFYGNRGTAAPTGLPANYSDLVAGVNGNDPVVAVASRKATLASEDPGSFTTSGSDTWNAGTVAIRAAA